ncbi:MAG: extracellular solute-binding protein [Actinomycetota bacterium]|nr:extracellular solute-binding protein [Actinomycetota bacterium]
MDGRIFGHFKFKEMKFVKLLTKIAILSICIFMITALSCRMLDSGGESDTGQDNDETVESDGNGTGDDDKLDVTITLWDCLEPKGRLALMEKIDDFTDANSYIEIETEHFRSQEELEDKFEAASLAGAGPELILLDFDGVQRLSPGNVVKEISGETISDLSYSMFLDGLVEISEYNSRNYIIPFRSFDFLVLFYNRDIVEEPPSEFEEVIEYCRETNKPGENLYGFLLNSNEADWIIPFIGGYGDWIVDYSYRSLTLDNEATEKTMEFLNYMYNEEKILYPDMDYSGINELFKNGSAHMIMDSVSMAEEYELAGINTGVARIPQVWQGSKNPTPLISGLGFMINVNCYGNELEAVDDLIVYMLTEEVQVEWTSRTNTFPALKSVDRNDEFAKEELRYGAFQQAKLCRGKPYEELIIVIRDAIRDNTQRVISQDMLPADAALKIQEDALRLRSGDAGVEEESGEDEETE